MPNFLHICYLYQVKAGLKDRRLKTSTNIVLKKQVIQRIFLILKQNAKMCNKPSISFLRRCYQKIKNILSNQLCNIAVVKTIFMKKMWGQTKACPLAINSSILQYSAVSNDVFSEFFSNRALAAMELFFSSLRLPIHLFRLSQVTFFLELLGSVLVISQILKYWVNEEKKRQSLMEIAAIQ